MGVDEVVDPQALTDVQYPAVGSQAPEFTLRSQHGADVAPVGNGSWSLVVFYPFAFSSICATELNDLQVHLGDFDDAGIGVIAVSCDPVYGLRAMADAAGLSLTLLSDFWPHGAVALDYGCFDENLGAASRSSYLLDPAGRIAWSLHHGLGEQRPIDLHLDAITRVS